MVIKPHNNICKSKHLTENKEYEILDTDDDMPEIPDMHFKIRNDEGKEIWIDDWDCNMAYEDYLKVKPRI